MLGIKNASSSFPSKFSVVCWIHAFICSIFFFFLNTNYVLGLILICVGDTGTEGAIAGLQENSQLSKGDT